MLKLIRTTKDIDWNEEDDQPQLPGEVLLHFFDDNPRTVDEAMVQLVTHNNLYPQDSWMPSEQEIQTEVAQLLRKGYLRIAVDDYSMGMLFSSFHTMPLTQKVIKYYNQRELEWPNFEQAIGWQTTELGEAWELILAKDSKWVRNNPDEKEPFSKERLSEELGDAIMMLIVAGIVEGVDPVKSLENKMTKKLQSLKK